MNKTLKHIRKWNRWRKCSLDSKLYKIGVLLKFVNSPTFIFMI
jgi:hypothetical protein